MQIKYQYHTSNTHTTILNLKQNVIDLLTYAAFTLNGFDNQERNLMLFVFQV